MSNNSIDPFINMINDQVDQDCSQNISILQDLVKYPTEINEGGRIGNEGPAQEYLHPILANCGLDIEMFEPDVQKLKENHQFDGYNSNCDLPYTGRPNLIARYRGLGGGRSLILNGHIDVVPAGDPHSWIHGPFEGSLVDGFAWGRGTSDAKGPLAAAVCAIVTLHKIGALNKLKGAFELQSSVCEEGWGQGTLAICDRGCHADGAINLEPTNLRIITCHRGDLLAKIRVSGLRCHASMYWQGVNANEKAAKIIGALQELHRKWMFTTRDPILPPDHINVGVISGGDLPNVVSDNCVMGLDIHYLPREVDEHGLGGNKASEVAAWIDMVCKGDEWLREHPAEFEVVAQAEPFQIDPGHPLVQVISESCEAVQGRHELAAFESGSDARFLSRLAKTPTVIYGPGDIQFAHTINERVNVDDYLTAIKTIAITILNWCER